MSLRSRLDKLERDLAPQVDAAQPPLLTRDEMAVAAERQIERIRASKSHAAQQAAPPERPQLSQEDRAKIRSAINFQIKRANAIEAEGRLRGTRQPSPQRH